MTASNLTVASLRQRLDNETEQQVYFASPEDTILAKLSWYKQGGQVSERQLEDVSGILKVQGERLDMEYLNKWAAILGVDVLLRRILEEGQL